MNWKDYQKACLRTWNEDATYREQLDHAAMGVVSEALELQYAEGDDIADELGDVLFYVAMLAYLLGDDVLSSAVDISVASGISAREMAESMAELAVAALEELVKWQHHGRPDYRQDFVDSVWMTYSMARGFAGMCDLVVEDVLAQNVAKLEARHPDGFEGKGRRN